MEVKRVVESDIVKYRADYFNSLPEFQELFLELIVSSSDCYVLRLGKVDAGYAVCSAEGALVEFYVFNTYLSSSYTFFCKLIEQLSIKEIYCKSFDSALLSNCLLSSFTYSVVGVLYRDYVKPLVAVDPALIMKRAVLDSVELFCKQDESIKELFETDDVLMDCIQKENVFEFYIHDVFVGCGLITRVNKNWNFCDLGVWVNPLERGKGIASQIIIRLRDFALEKGMEPCCGCAIDNIASQKAIERSGYVSRYKLVCFETE